MCSVTGTGWLAELMGLTHAQATANTSSEGAADPNVVLGPTHLNHPSRTQTRRGATNPAATIPADAGAVLTPVAQVKLRSAWAAVER